MKIEKFSNFKKINEGKLNGKEFTRINSDKMELSEILKKIKSAYKKLGGKVYNTPDKDNENKEWDFILTDKELSKKEIYEIFEILTPEQEREMLRDQAKNNPK